MIKLNYVVVTKKPKLITQKPHCAMNTCVFNDNATTMMTSGNAGVGGGYTTTGLALFVFGGLFTTTFQILLRYAFRAIPLITYPLFGFKLYVIHRADLSLRLCKRSGLRSSNTLDGDTACGIVCGKWYIGEVEALKRWEGDKDMFMAWIFTNDACYKKLTNDDRYEIKALGSSKKGSDDVPTITDNNNSEKTSSNVIISALTNKSMRVGILENTSDYVHARFTNRNISIEHSPFEHQTKIMENIEKELSQRKCASSLTCYVHGPVGTGKSMMAILFAARIGAKYCKDLCLAKPGHSLKGLYTVAEATRECPLVLVFEEVDVMLGKIHEGKLVEHKNHRREIADKSDWNSMLDDIDTGIYPHLILFLISNKSPSEIDTELDSSFLRKGRVHVVYEMSTTVSKV